MLEKTWEERYWAARDLAWKLYAPEASGTSVERGLDEAEAFFKDHPAKDHSDWNRDTPLPEVHWGEESSN